MNGLRFGVLGTGRVVREFHLPALAANSRARVVAIGNHRAASLRPLARQFQIDKTYTDFDLMARDREIDVVINALPNFLHAPVTISMLQHGKHVLCEKPMATTVSQAQAMAAAADTVGRQLMIAHVWRSNLEVQWLREIVRSGAIGTVTKAKAHAIVAGRGPEADSWFVRREMSGGGALADVGIHGIDTLSFLFDDRLNPVKVTARTANTQRPLEIEDTASVVIEYDNGLVAELEAGWYHANVSNPHGAVELFGTAGYARTLPARLESRAEDSRPVTIPSFGMQEPHIELPMYAAQIDDFVACVLEDRQPACDGHQGVRTMVVLEAAYASARGGSSVSLQSPVLRRGRPATA
jgi:predicted dehydrogenase